MSLTWMTQHGRSARMESKYWSVVIVVFLHLIVRIDGNCDYTLFEECFAAFTAIDRVADGLASLDDFCWQYREADNCILNATSSCPDEHELLLAWLPIQGGTNYLCSTEGQQGYLAHSRCIYGHEGRNDTYFCQSQYERGFEDIEVKTYGGGYKDADEIYHDSCDVVNLFLSCTCIRTEADCGQGAAAFFYKYIGHTMYTIWQLFFCYDIIGPFPRCGSTVVDPDEVYVYPINDPSDTQPAVPSDDDDPSPTTGGTTPDTVSDLNPEATGSHTTYSQDIGVSAAVATGPALRLSLLTLASVFTLLDWT